MRKLIEALKSEDVEQGISIGVYNKRGVTTRGIGEGGKQEDKIAERYKGYAAAVRGKWHRTARLLDKISQAYVHDAQREDQRVEVEEQLWASRRPSRPRNPQPGTATTTEDDSSDVGAPEQAQAGKASAQVKTSPAKKASTKKQAKKTPDATRTPAAKKAKKATAAKKPPVAKKPAAKKPPAAKKAMAPKKGRR